MYENTREWWDSVCESTGKRHADMQLKDLELHVGGVNRGAWGKRREAARARYDISFGKLRSGCPATHQVAPSSPDEPTYKSTLKFNADGSRDSDKLVWMTDQQGKDETFLLTAHGFDPEEWELVSAVQNIWQQASKNTDDSVTVTNLYQSKVTVRPKTERWSFADLAQSLKAGIKPVSVKMPKVGKKALEVTPVDMHFGNSDFEWYKPNLARTLEHIRARVWDRIIVRISDDFFHTDNFKNTTSNGTPQSSMWWPDAYRDGMRFVDTILLAALEQSASVYFVWVPGNHDESMSWCFVQALKERYPQVTFDDEIAERKVHVFYDCAIGMTHGDEKVRKDLDRVFISEFPEFAMASHREVHMAHLHHEKSTDNFGVMSRSLPTSARTDKWHRSEGFVGARKTFQLFEWERGRGVTDIHYV